MTSKTYNNKNILHQRFITLANLNLMIKQSQLKLHQVKQFQLPENKQTK